MLFATIAGNAFLEAQQMGMPQWASICLGILGMVIFAFVKEMMAPSQPETDTDHD